MAKTIVKYVMTTAIAVVITLIVAEFRSGLEFVTAIQAWCDGFFVSGGVMLSLGLLFFCNNMGAADGLFYSTKRFLSAIFKAQIYSEDYASYKEQKRKKQTPFMHMVIVGGAFILVAIVLLIVYYSA